MKKTYYFPDSDYADNFFVNGEAVCFNLAEAKRLAGEWGMSMDEVMDQLHEATESEIAEYGTYEA